MLLLSGFEHMLKTGFRCYCDPLTLLAPSINVHCTIHIIHFIYLTFSHTYVIESDIHSFVYLHRNKSNVGHSKMYMQDNKAA